jgi:hypothetical protein
MGNGPKIKLKAKLASPSAGARRARGRRSAQSLFEIAFTRNQFPVLSVQLDDPRFIGEFQIPTLPGTILLSDICYVIGSLISDLPALMRIHLPFHLNAPMSFLPSLTTKKEPAGWQAP